MLVAFWRCGKSSRNASEMGPSNPTYARCGPSELPLGTSFYYLEEPIIWSNMDHQKVDEVHCEVSQVS